MRAICLDGGGSSAMALRKPGEETAALISSPSDGSQRACANYIFFINNVPRGRCDRPRGAHAELPLCHARRVDLVLGQGRGDASYGPAEAPADLTYTVSNSLGTVDGQTFTAGDATGTATITGSTGRGRRLDG